MSTPVMHAVFSPQLALTPFTVLWTLLSLGRSSRLEQVGGLAVRPRSAMGLFSKTTWSTDLELCLASPQPCAT